MQDKVLYIWDEIYKTGLTNPEIYREIAAAGYGKETITADSAEPKSIAELRNFGLRVRPAVKGPDSIRHGIQFLQGFRMVVHPRCVNFETEISNYTWATDKAGTRLNVPIDEFNHLLDALRYATEKLVSGGVRYHGYEGGI
jgi:phage terminase large subunit